MTYRRYTVEELQKSDEDFATVKGIMNAAMEKKLK